MNLRAQELPIKAYVNSHTNNSITTIDVDKVSANYPYLKRLAPNIDFKLKTIIKKFNNNSCHLSFEGTHDLFPAYELIIQDRVIYSHKPIGKGPGVINLNLQTRFHKSIFL